MLIAQFLAGTQMFFMLYAFADDILAREAKVFANCAAA
jgi:hypothetical protein